MQDFFTQERIITGINNLRRIFLDKKPHIKAYYKTRNIHSEIINAMIQYHHDGNFKRQFERAEPNIISETKPENIHLLESKFDLNTREGGQAFYDMLIYKPAPEINCITDDFIRNHRYKKPEKIDFLHSMSDSKLGLFEVTGTDMENGYAYIKNVFTDVEYKIIDIGLSGQQNYDTIYLYTRIITYGTISFSTGLNLIFTKTDKFIKNHIQKYKKDFNPNWEFVRFIELYNHFSKDKDRVKIVTNKL
jgi:hypothetical protein